MQPDTPSNSTSSPYTQEFFGVANKSEDCLYLNVWTAAESLTDRRPVLVWIHGGGFAGGSGSAPITDGENLARSGLVVVAVNYRLGLFGFFAHPDLTKESGVHASGNYGFLDQIAALQWVQRNIAAFGGDPGKVTIAGESAGSMSVSALMASPLAKGLFHRALGESGALLGTMSPVPLPVAEQAGVEFARSQSVTSVQELRKMTAIPLLRARSQSRPVIDGYVLPSDVYTTFSQGKQNDVPLMGGWNIDDVTSREKGVTAEVFRIRARQRYGLHAAEILQAYPANTDAQAQSSWTALSRDCCYAWQERTWLRLQRLSGKSKSYLYYFTRVPPGPPEYTAFGAFHGSQIAYSLNTLQKWNRPWTPTDQALSKAMSSYLVNFVSTGDPNGEGLVPWPTYTPETEQVVEFGDKIGVREVPSAPQLDVLDAVYERK